MSLLIGSFAVPLGTTKPNGLEKMDLDAQDTVCAQRRTSGRHLPHQEQCTRPRGRLTILRHSEELSNSRFFTSPGRHRRGPPLSRVSLPRPLLSRPRQDTSRSSLSRAVHTGCEHTRLPSSVPRLFRELVRSPVFCSVFQGDTSDRATCNPGALERPKETFP